MTQYQKDFLTAIGIIISIVVVVSIPIFIIVNAVDTAKCRAGGYADSITWNSTKLCIVIRDGQFEVLQMGNLEKIPDAE